MTADLKDGSHRGLNINECAEPGEHTETEKTEIRKTRNKSKSSTKLNWPAELSAQSASGTMAVLPSDAA